MGLIQPFTGSRTVTQGYGPTSNSFEPGYAGYAHFHTGVDYAVPADTQLYAASSGTVTYAGADTTGFGNRVDISFGNGFRILYGHLNSIGVKVGQVVRAGDPIGLSGSTGNSTGPHLHFALSQNGNWMDPGGFVGEPRGPVATPGGGGLFGNITGGIGSVVGGITSIPSIFGGIGNTVTSIPGSIAGGITGGIEGAAGGIANGAKIVAGALWDSVRKYVFIAGLLLVALVIIAAIVKGE